MDRIEEYVPEARITLVQLDSVAEQVDTTTETQVSGGGGQMGIPGAPMKIGISSSSASFHNAFIPTPEGGQHLLKLNTETNPIGVGHTLRVVWAMPDKARLGARLVAMKNLSTGTSTGLRGPGRHKEGNWKQLGDVMSWRAPRLLRMALRLSILGVIGSMGIALYFSGTGIDVPMALRSAVGLVLLFAALTLVACIVLWPFTVARRRNQIFKRAMTMIDQT